LDESLAPAAAVAALFLLGAVCVARPGLLTWRDGSVLAAGLSWRARARATRAAGAGVLLLSLWLAWRFFVAAA
jgi:hypothetical protein